MAEADDGCACSNILVMQLFHELKQKFPAVPDRVVSDCVRQNRHDKRACEIVLRRENQGYLMHSYPVSLKMTSAVEEIALPDRQKCDRCRDTYVSSREVDASDVIGRDDRLTGTQWFAQGTTTQYRPGGDNSAAFSPMRDNNDQRCPQFPDMTFARGAAQYQCVESKSAQYFSQVAGESGDSSRLSDVSNGVPRGRRAVQSRSSLSVQSSTTFHKHCDRPCSLDVTSPRSAPELPPSFEPFNRLLQSRSIPVLTPTTPTTPSDNYPSYLANCDSSPSTASENNLNHPLGQSTHCPPDCQMNLNCARTDDNPRARSALNVEPAPHYASRNYWGGGGGTLAVSPSQQPRSYTSVNLTLRPPSLEPLPPIEIESGGASLTYSTSSYDPRQGFQSQLQIRIGPGGVGSVSALRTRVPDARWSAPDALARTESLPDVAALALQSDEHSETSLRAQIDALGGDRLQARTRALLGQQLERKNRLRSELAREKHKLRTMHCEVQLMAEDLARRQLLHQRTADVALPVVTSVLQKVQVLRQEIQFLQEECKKMTTEVDLSSDDRVPLGETDEAFYENIYTGQRGCVLNNRLPTANTQRREVRSARPPPSPLDALDLDGPNWTCSECTFRNHPLLDKCEQCEMPRIVLGTDSRVDRHVDCFCHPADALDKILLPSPLLPLPRMVRTPHH